MSLKSLHLDMRSILSALEWKRGSVLVGVMNGVTEFSTDVSVGPLDKQRDRIQRAHPLADIVRD